ncbi:MAG: nucleotidyltransferase family protein [Leptospirales bacterium]
MNHDLGGFILMAGSGSRLRPLFPDRPKPLVPVDGRPLALHIMESMKRSGIDQVVVNLHDRAEAIRSGLDPVIPNGMVIRYSMEDRVLGTGGGVLNAWPLIKEMRILVMRTCDILTPYNVSGGILRHEEERASVTLVLSGKGPESEAGKIFLSPDGSVVLPGELPGPGDKPVWFTGIHIVDPQVFKPEGELPSPPFSVFEFYRRLKKRGGEVRGQEIREGWLDLGTEDGYRQLPGFLEAWPEAIHAAEEPRLR